jgi:peroxiredoxin
MKMRFAGSMALGALLALASSASAAAALAPGAVAPTFTAQASQAGKEFTFSLADALKKGPVVVYFYPSAYTGGCDLEAHTFAVNRDKFDAAGATIIGVSADSIERLDQFSADPKYCAGKFPVASDAEVKVALSYGLEAMEAHPGMKDVRGVAIDHSFIPRTTFVISSDGKIVATLSSETDHLRPDEHVKQSLANVQRLQAGKAP